LWVTQGELGNPNGGDHVDKPTAPRLKTNRTSTSARTGHLPRK
jgi:hypothetical protein